MKPRTDFRTRAATVAALGVLGIVMPLTAVAPRAWSPVAQAAPVENQPSNPSGSNSLSRGDVDTPGPAAKAQPDPIYSSCTQVWAQGKGPIYQGQPGYSAYLDPDGNGVACES